MKDNRENYSSAAAGANPAVTANAEHMKPCWYWDKKDLAHTPSQSESMDPATEARYRREGARFIFDVGTRLGLHYDTLATGIIYFHRFYMFHSFKQFPRYVTGGCCLFLAGKVEETPKKCKDIIKTARSLLTDIQFAQFGDDPKEEVMVLERILLQTIKFDLQVDHPYQFLLRYAKQLKGDKNKVQKLVQMAWTFVNDSLCTMLSLQWEPEIIAVAVMYLAGRLCKVDIQEWTSKQSSRRWWEQFVQDVPMEVLEDICHQILDLYSQGKQQMPQGAGPAVAGGAGEKAPSSSATPSPPQVQLPTTPTLLPPPPPAPPLVKKPSPQTSPPRQAPKRPPQASPKDDGKTSEITGAKIPRLEPPMPPLPTAPAPPERKAPPPSYPAAPLPPAEPDPPSSSSSDPSDPSKASSSAAPPPPPAAVAPPAHLQPPPLPHRPPPPPPQQPPAPPPSTYIMGIPTSSSYMSGEGFQSLQSMMMKTAECGPSSYPAMPPQAYAGPPLGYHPHAYPTTAPPPLPPAVASYHNPPPLSASYPPPLPPAYNHGYPPPLPSARMGLVAQHPHGLVGIIPPSAGGYPLPPPPLPNAQGQVPPPLLPGMPPMGGMGRGWMR